MANEYNIRRVAFGNITMPTNNSANTASTLSVGSGVYVPAGAIVTGIKFLPGGAITNGSNFKNATVNAYVGTVVMGTNDRKASEAILQTAAKSLSPVAADGILVPATGELIIHFASSDSARTGIAFDTDVYVEYLYCSERDAA
jgi:hypothetical protein